MCIYTKKSLATGAPPRTTLGELMTLPQTLSQTPDVLRAPVGLAASYLQFAPSALVPDCGAQIMVTLVCYLLCSLYVRRSLYSVAMEKDVIQRLIILTDTTYRVGLYKKQH